MPVFQKRETSIFSSRFKLFIGFIFVALTLFFSRHLIFAHVLQLFLSRVTHDQFEYAKRSWDDGKLVYEGVSFGKELSSSRMEFTPYFSFSPLHLKLGIYLTEPHFKLSTDAEPAFNLALFVPTKWTTVRLDIERGALSINDKPVGLVEFISGETSENLGQLILSEEDKSAYCTTDLSFKGTDLSYQIICSDAPILHLQMFATLFAHPLPLKIESGKINAEIQGIGAQFHGFMKGNNLAFRNEKYGIEQSELTIQLHQDKAPYMHAKGVLSFGETTGPYVCDFHNGVGHLNFSGVDIPFALSSQNKHYAISAQLQHIPLKWFEFPRGKVSANLKADFKDYSLNILELKNISLLEITKDPLQGELSCIGPFQELSGEFLAFTSLYGMRGQGAFQFQQERLTWEGQFLVFTDEVKANGYYDISSTQWNVEFSTPSALLSNYTSLFPEGTAEIHGSCNPHTVALKCMGSNLLFQKEDVVLQMHGKTAPVQLSYHIHSKELFAEMALSPAVLYLKKMNSPIYLESGALQYKDGALDIARLEACFEEIVFIGDLHATENHLQLKSDSVQGGIQDLAQFDTRFRGWEGEFACGKEEFLLDLDLQEQKPQMQLTAHVKNLSHRIKEHISLTQGQLTLNYESIGGEFSCSNMSGKLLINEREISLYFNKLSGLNDRIIFEGAIPDEKIVFIGTYEDDSLIFSHLVFGKSKINAPLSVSLHPTRWKMSGSAHLSLDAIPHYLSIIHDAGYLKQITLPPLSGEIGVDGWITNKNAAFDLHSIGFKFGETAVPLLQGQIVKENTTYNIHNLRIGEIDFQACCIFDKNILRIPSVSMQFKELYLEGSGSYTNDVLCVQTNGGWKESKIQASVKWNVKTAQGAQGLLQIVQDDLNLQCSAPTFYWKDSKLQIAQLDLKALHPKLKESIEVPLAVTWTPKQILFQGPLKTGSYSHEMFELKAKEIQGLYENGILHFQSKLKMNETPMKLKGHFFVFEGGRGAVNITEGEDHLHIGFNTFSDVAKVEGKLLGIECKLIKNDTLYEGKIKLISSDPLALCLKKPEWKGTCNLAFSGMISYPTFTGEVSGQDLVLKGYSIEQLSGKVYYTPTHFTIKDLQLDDRAGKLQVKECHGVRSHPLKAWEFTIPNLRGQKIQPSLLRQFGVSNKEPKPFQMRQLTLSNVKGILGRPMTLEGSGTFYFTQKEKRDPSLFDLPRAFLKEWGLDVALLSPVRGSVDIELKQGKIFLKTLNEAFSDGEHSQFQLVENEPSYIDYNGNLFLNLRMKQNVSLKLIEPFVLSVRGTWEKPHYTLR